MPLYANAAGNALLLAPSGDALRGCCCDGRKKKSFVLQRITFGRDSWDDLGDCTCGIYARPQTGSVWNGFDAEDAAAEANGSMLVMCNGAVKGGYFLQAYDSGVFRVVKYGVDGCGFEDSYYYAFWFQ